MKTPWREHQVKWDGKTERSRSREQTDVLVRMEAVSKHYLAGDLTVDVLRDINLEIPRGEFVVVLGVSGSGKTTLLNLMGALDTPSSGLIRVDGVEVSAVGERARTEFRREKVGFIFQFYNLLPTLSARENVEAALEILPLTRAEIAARSRHYLEGVGLEDRQDKFPSQLSGGEQQRVGIARALAKEPALVLADEPTGNLDEDTGLRIVDLMRKLQREKRTTVVLVTHNPRLTAFADRIVRIEHRTCAEVTRVAAEQD